MDIVVTIPRSEYKNDDKETEYFQKNPDAFQFWTLKRIPTKLRIGDRCYFVKNNKIDSSMKVFDMGDGDNHCDVTGRNWKGFTIYLNDLRKENLDMKVKGFQGFRYKWW